MAPERKDPQTELVRHNFSGANAAKFTAGAGLMYSTPETDAAYTAEAAEMYSSTGAGAVWLTASA